jgi:hypothetical protein
VHCVANPAMQIRVSEGAAHQPVRVPANTRLQEVQVRDLHASFSCFVGKSLILRPGGNKLLHRAELRTSPQLTIGLLVPDRPSQCPALDSPACVAWYLRVGHHRQYLFH